jgi:periplasmic copper chaperone A
VSFAFTRRIIAMTAIVFAAGMGCTTDKGPALNVQAWARATPPAATVGGAYLTIRNSGPNDRLVRVRSPLSESAEIHQTSMADGQMQMRQIDALDIPANGEIKLEPGGMHLMLIGLKQPLKEGEVIPLTLEFERAGTLQVQAPVAAIGASEHSEH